MVSIVSRVVNAPETRIAAWGGLLNAVWEFLQSPLYADWDEGAWHVIWTRLHCTGGDVLILLGAFWATALVFGTRRWIARQGIGAWVLFMLLGLGYTIFSEIFNTQIVRSWEYAPAMPTVFGLGLTPMLQWLIVPPIVLSLARHTIRPTAEGAQDGRWSAAQ